MEIKDLWISMASLMGILAFCQTLLSTICPPDLRFFLAKIFTRLSNYYSSYCYFDITDIDGVSTNQLYDAVQLYLSSCAASSSDTTRLTLTRALKSSSVTYGLSNNNTLLDTFNGVTVHWEHVVTQRQSQTFGWRPLSDEKRRFSLRIPKSHKSILDSYLDHVTERAREIRRQNRDRFLFTNHREGSFDGRGHPWESVPFKHPSTFDTLAIDPAKKAEIMADLRDFADGEAFYNRTGRAWKRGYLLYGPPGTGKSSMIAAMANYLRYDIYDLELTEVASNSALRKLLMKTKSKSIIVIEDIDCSLNFKDRNQLMAGRRSSDHCTDNCSHSPPDMTRSGGGRGEKEESGGNRITLSGLLNFTDGLWSCCGSERIFVFTTNHIDKLDQALLRSGRMDMHIHMSYCSMPALRILMKNYLGSGEEEGGAAVEEALMWEMEGVIDEAEMTPADMSEVLIRKRRDKGKAVRELLEELKRRVERKRGDGGGSGSMETKAGGEEEQEKRALEINPKEGRDDDEFLEDSCIVGKDNDGK